MAQHRRVNRGHSGRRRPARLRPLDRRKPRFEHRNRRVAETRILVMRNLAFERRLGLLGIVINKARGKEQRFGVLREIGPDLAGMNERGSGTVRSVGHAIPISQIRSAAKTVGQCP